MHTRYLRHALLIIGICAAQLSYAECPDGKAAVVVVTPSGISKDICVAQAAIPGLESAPDHAATELGPSCPCADLWMGDYQEGDELQTSGGSAIPVLPPSLDGYTCTASNGYIAAYTDLGAGTGYHGIRDTFDFYASADLAGYATYGECATLDESVNGYNDIYARRYYYVGEVDFGYPLAEVIAACRQFLEVRGCEFN